MSKKPSEYPVPSGTAAELHREIPGCITNEFRLKWFELMTYKVGSTIAARFVIYWVGKQSQHLMDWRGCNFHHGRIKGSPVFKTPMEAFDWLQRATAAGFVAEGMHLRGHHSGEYACSKGCDERELQTIFFRDLEKKNAAQMMKKMKSLNIKHGEDDDAAD